MNTLNDKCEHIILQYIAADRAQAHKANKRLLLIYWLVLFILLAVFMQFVITDPNYINEYSESTSTYIIGMSVWLWGALFFAYMIMWLPSMFFAKAVNPEIFFTDTRLIYLSGSMALNYSGLLALHRPLIFLLGYDVSQNISRDEVTSIGIEKAGFLKPGFGVDEQIVIKHKAGEIKTGIWLSQDEKQAIVKRLNDWIKQ
jgi:hypothetical protein